MVICFGLGETPRRCPMSTYVEMSRILTTVGSAGMIYALYAQALKVWKRKSADDIHLAIAVVPFLSSMIWFNYGISIKEWPIQLICGLELPASALICIGYFRYCKDPLGSLKPFVQRLLGRRKRG